MCFSIITSYKYPLSRSSSLPRLSLDSLDGEEDSWALCFNLSISSLGRIVRGMVFLGFVSSSNRNSRSRGGLSPLLRFRDLGTLLLSLSNFFLRNSMSSGSRTSFSFAKASLSFVNLALGGGALSLAPGLGEKLDTGC